jgi:hypothetical protein
MAEDAAHLTEIAAAPGERRGRRGRMASDNIRQRHRAAYASPLRHPDISPHAPTVSAPRETDKRQYQPCQQPVFVDCYLQASASQPWNHPARSAHVLPPPPLLHHSLSPSVGEAAYKTDAADSRLIGHSHAQIVVTTLPLPSKQPRSIGHPDGNV